MEIITLDGLALSILLDLLDRLTRPPDYAVDPRPDPDPNGIYRTEIWQIQVARDHDGVKFTINGSDWSPPYPLAAEDVARLARS